MSDSIFYRYFLCRMWHVQGVDVFAAFGLCRGILLPSFILDSRCGSSFVSFLEQNSQNLKRVLLVIACILFLGVYIWRMLDVTDTIVVFQPENGILAKVFFRLIQK